MKCIKSIGEVDEEGFIPWFSGDTFRYAFVGRNGYCQWFLCKPELIARGQQAGRRMIAQQVRAARQAVRESERTQPTPPPGARRVTLLLSCA